MEPVKISYRSYKYFNESEFRTDLLKNLQIIQNEAMRYDEFKQTFIQVLDCHALKKTKVVR